jgi:hypothetical protein
MYFWGLQFNDHRRNQRLMEMANQIIWCLIVHKNTQKGTSRLTLVAKFRRFIRERVRVRRQKQLGLIRRLKMEVRMKLSIQIFQDPTLLLINRKLKHHNLKSPKDLKFSIVITQLGREEYIFLRIRDILNLLKAKNYINWSLRNDRNYVTT